MCGNGSMQSNSNKCIFAFHRTGRNQRTDFDSVMDL